MARATTTTPTDDLRAFLTWTRVNGFRVQEIEMGGVKVRLDDLRAEASTKPEAPSPRNAHEAWATQFGMELPPEFDDEDGAQS